MLKDGKFVKLNHFQNHLSEKDLKYYCWKLKPWHVYFSVLNWLFPERARVEMMARAGKVEMKKLINLNTTLLRGALEELENTKTPITVARV